MRGIRSIDVEHNAGEAESWTIEVYLEIVDVAPGTLEAGLAAIAHQEMAAANIDQSGVAGIQATLNQRRRSGNIAHAGVDYDVVAETSNVPGAKNKSGIRVLGARQQGRCRERRANDHRPHGHG